jgi:CubicO group peptidase (beta-lactamase class C family)
MVGEGTLVHSSPVTASETPATLTADLRRLARKAQADGRVPSVTAAVARNGETVWADAIGLADVETGREATLDDQYRVGSITKTFTAAAVMILRDEGALELEAPLDAYLPDVPHAPSLRFLLAHASGLQREVPGDDYW